MTDAKQLESRHRTAATVFLSLMIIGCVVGVAVPAGIRWDFAVFYDAGRRALAMDFAHLFDGHALIAGEPPQGTLQFWGAPISAFLYVPLAWLAPVWALTALKLQNVIAYLLGLYLLHAHLQPMAGKTDLDKARFTAWFAGMALLFQPFWTVFRVGGQTTPTVFLLLVVGLLCHTRQRFWWSAIAFAAAVLIKPAFAPALLLLGLISGIGYFVRVAAVMTGIGVASVLLLGWPIHEEFLRNMLQGSVGAAVAWEYSGSLYVLLASLKPLVSAGTAQALGMVGSILKIGVVVATIALIWRTRSARLRPAAQLHYYYLIALGFFLFTAAVLWEHYLTALFPILAFVVANRSHFSAAARRIVVVIVALSIFQNLIVVRLIQGVIAVDSVPSVAIASLVKSAPVLLALYLMLRYHKSFLESHRTIDWDVVTDARAGASSQSAGSLSTRERVTVPSTAS
jgi:hypothetical protein